MTDGQLCIRCREKHPKLPGVDYCMNCINKPRNEDEAQTGTLLETKDNGKREKYPTGAMRSDRTGRGRYDLIPPIGLKRLAIRCEAGVSQKGERNWELGFPISRALCSAVGHLYDYLAGDREEDHLAAAAWQCFAAMHLEEKVKEGQWDALSTAMIDDVPKKGNEDAGT